MVKQFLFSLIISDHEWSGKSSFILRKLVETDYSVTPGRGGLETLGLKSEPRSEKFWSVFTTHAYFLNR